MTKLKSKKMTKSTLAIIIMAIAIVAMLAFGGTYAFFTAEAKTATSSVTMGTIDLSVGAFTLSSGNKVTDDVVFNGSVTYTSNANVKSIVIVEYEGDAAVFNFTVGSDFTLITGLDGAKKYYYAILTGDGTTQTKNFINSSTIKINVSDNMKQSNLELKAALVAAKTANTSWDTVSTDYATALGALPAATQAAIATAYGQSAAAIEAINFSDSGYMGKTYNISIAAEAIQYRGITYDTSSVTTDDTVMTNAIAQAAAVELFGATVTPVAP